MFFPLKSNRNFLKICQKCHYELAAVAVRTDVLAEAATWLSAAAEESQKTSNVDLNLLITNCENCAGLVQDARKKEENTCRQAGLDQLLITIGDHLEVLRAKKEQLESGVRKNSSTFPASKQTGSENSKTETECQQRRLAIQDTIISNSDVGFDDVAGLDKAKQILKEAIIMPVQYPQLFTGARKPWKRILMYGPPGTGKTRLAQAVAKEIDSVFYCVSSSDLVSSWVGESEKLVKELFHHANQQEGRSVIFIDEIDSICRTRSSREEEHTRRIKTELLKQMEGADTVQDATRHLFLMCATNRPWELDTAFLRRFQKRVYIPLPDFAARIAMLKIHTSSCNFGLTDPDLEAFAEKTEGFSGSDLSNVVMTALFEPIRDMQEATHWKEIPDGKFTPCSADEADSIEKTMKDFPSDQVQPRDVTLQDLVSSLQTCQKTVSQEELDKFEEFTSHLGLTG